MECKEELDDERNEMKNLLSQQASIIEAFHRQARKQSRTSVARNPLTKIKFKRRIIILITSGVLKFVCILHTSQIWKPIEKTNFLFILALRII